MPIHDWSRVDAGLFHHFHQRWIAALCDALNAGRLPPGYPALGEQVASGPIPDVATIEDRSPPPRPDGSPGGLAVAESPPRAWAIRRAEVETYAERANRVAIHHPLGELVAVIEIVSPGNKGSRHAPRAFAAKAADLLRRGVHLLVVDLFPPTPRDPVGIHPAIRDAFVEEPFEPPAGRPLTVASYAAGEVKVAYVEPVAIGDTLPEMPLFLSESTYVFAPLEAAYLETWSVCPASFREAVLGA